MSNYHAVLSEEHGFLAFGEFSGHDEAISEVVDTVWSESDLNLRVFELTGDQTYGLGNEVDALNAADEKAAGERRSEAAAFNLTEGIEAEQRRQLTGEPFTVESTTKSCGMGKRLPVTKEAHRVLGKTRWLRDLKVDPRDRKGPLVERIKNLRAIK